MLGARGNTDNVADPDEEFFTLQGHTSFVTGDVMQLFGLVVKVKASSAAGLDSRFSKALSLVALD
ncbi:MAG: hypothetical protein H6R10_3473 [Rhodocyclaceae bacterium]|nr:hypothetical protein [Rhodocyclaceae bacterium]